MNKRTRRRNIVAGAALFLLSIGAAWLISGAQAATRPCTAPVARNGVITADVAVIGAHAAGLGAAITAARHCLSVVLVSNEQHPGGMLTAGQIGFTDGNPVYYWPDRKTTTAPNGGIPPTTSWAVVGGVWRDFRAAISPNLPSTLRFTPAAAAAAAEKLLRLPSLLVLRSTTPTAAVMNGSHVDHADVVGPTFTGRINATYWVDGSDTGDLAGLLNLPHTLDPDVMAYAYRWTAIADSSGLYPTSPPAYYSINQPDIDKVVSQAWPTYQADMQLADGATATVNPFRLLNNQGRLVDTQPELWDVNNGGNDAVNATIGSMLQTDPDTKAILRRNGLPNEYTAVSDRVSPEWANIAWIKDQAPVAAADKQLLIAKIEAAAKARSLGLLWYIRSGDMAAELHRLPGGANLTVDQSWSISNQLGTPDGLPELLYQREGRHIVGEYHETVYDLCPTFDQDRLQPARICTTAPRSLPDPVAVTDYNVDIRSSGAKKPFLFSLPRPHQTSFRSMIPKGTTGLLVAAGDVDAYAFGALRTEPARLLAGGALGEGIALAAASKTTSFQTLNVERLREVLAARHQETFYVQTAPTWANGWHDTKLGDALQVLIARNLIPHPWAKGSSQGTTVLAASLDLSGTNAQALMRGMHGRCSSRPPWAKTMPGSVLAAKVFRRAARGSANVGDAYRWLLAHCAT